MDTFGQKLRALMAERQISQRKLAKLVPCDDGHLSKIANDRKNPSLELARRLDDFLEANGELAALRRPGRSEQALTPDEGERLRLAAGRPSRVDQGVVQALATVLAAQRRLEDSVGSAVVIPAVDAQVAEIERMVIDACGDVRPSLLNVAAQWSQFAGWLHANVGEHVAGLRYLGRTLQWATEIGDRQLIGAVMSWQGYIAERRGQIGAMIGLSQAGQRLRAGSVGRVYDLYQEARALASLGEADQVSRLTDMAAAEAAEARPEAARPWEYYYFEPGFFGLEHGLTYRILGHTDPAYNDASIEHLTAGLGSLPPDMRSSEWAGDFVYQLALAHRQAGDSREAERTTRELEEIASRIDSARLARLLSALREPSHHKRPG
ncbi:helix-turn-helix transcriptional regulator [Actinomadura sp. BRA 177]|uniref:helix-turn-helix transcriptional regulator n=1 Tax=Actinomadura sp. BRA 177 TaxID=2745202 RepID=UPI00159536BC|nr:helix-turn-helix transcriptional regulator [Actinomadura sp. BRA 177]NVI91163.1 helix-turn-helix transcriptional regulator [Actinomadura sp. BRA 177]